jgi:hypothetical protein
VQVRRRRDQWTSQRSWVNGNKDIGLNIWRNARVARSERDIENSEKGNIEIQAQTPMERERCQRAQSQGCFSVFVVVERLALDSAVNTVWRVNETRSCALSCAAS